MEPIGAASGIDLALAVVEQDFGHALALEVARDLVMYLKRPGGQSQFSVQLASQAVQQRNHHSQIALIERTAGLGSWSIETSGQRLECSAGLLSLLTGLSAGKVLPLSATAGSGAAD